MKNQKADYSTFLVSFHRAVLTNKLIPTQGWTDICNLPQPSERCSKTLLHKHFLYYWAKGIEWGSKWFCATTPIISNINT